MTHHIYLVFTFALALAACQPNKSSTDLSLIELHNQARQQGIKCGLLFKHKAPALEWSDLLANAAHKHSLEMVTLQRLTHISPSNQNAGDRINAVGYQWRSYAENLAKGVYTDASVFKLWINSPEHCNNIANAEYTEMGAAQVNGYWTALYAKPK